MNALAAESLILVYIAVFGAPLALSFVWVGAVRVQWVLSLYI